MEPETAFLTGSQMVVMLLVWALHTESCSDSKGEKADYLLGTHRVSVILHTYDIWFTENH